MKEEENLSDAIEYAFKFDKRVMIEEFIDGFEVAARSWATVSPKTGEIDEIEISGDLFDFFEKYNLVTSKIHVPARVSKENPTSLKRLPRRYILRSTAAALPELICLCVKRRSGLQRDQHHSHSQATAAIP